MTKRETQTAHQKRNNFSQPSTVINHVQQSTFTKHSLTKRKLASSFSPPDMTWVLFLYPLLPH